jgi:uncharacterized membrane protein
MSAGCFIQDRGLRSIINRQGENLMKQENYDEGVTSTASIAGHPIHPMLVAYPIGFLVGGLLTDIAYWQTADPFWAQASLWLIGAGVVTSLLAAVFGLIDFVTIPRARNAAGWVHFLGNLLAVVLSAVSVLFRMPDPEAVVMPTGLAISAAVTVILLVTGWLGGELAFRYKVGVIGRGDQVVHRDAVAEAQRRRTV